MIISALLPIVYAFTTSAHEAEDLALLTGRPTEFDSQIDCTQPASLYETHFCQVFTNVEKYQRQCLPTRFLPPQDIPIRGLVINYHGYSACPDSFIPFSKQLSEQGYVVITPLLPGHGIILGYDCKKVTCVHNVNPTELPTTKDGYLDWSKSMASMANEQLKLIPEGRRSPDFKVSAVGLSVGGALALYATQLPQSPFNRTVLVNPYLSTSVPVLDFMIKNCEDADKPAKCVTNLLGNVIDGKPKDRSMSIILEPIMAIFRLIKKLNVKVFLFFVRHTLARTVANDYDDFWIDLWEKLGYLGDHSALQFLPVFKSGYGWGQGCRDTANRGGYCDFNLMGLQAFCTYTMAGLELVDGNVEFALVHSDIDGTVRDSQSLSVLKAINDHRYNKISRCRFKLIYNRTEIPGVNGNLGGAPHSMFSLPEARFNAPHSQYWRDSLYETINSFVNTGELKSGTGPENCEVTFDHLDYGDMFYDIGDQFLKVSKSIYGKKRASEVIADINANHP